MDAVFHILTSTVKTPEQAEDAVRRFRRAATGAGSGDFFLLLGFLPDAPGMDMPEDPPVIRTLQSGVMSMNARSETRFGLLIPKRTWRDADRVYAGFPGADACFSILRGLLVTGRTDAAFAAATVSPDAVRTRFSSCRAALFSSLSLVSAPDTPRRMLATLSRSPSGAVCAGIAEPRQYPQSILSRLLSAGFSLFPPLPAFLAPMQTERPLMVSADALRQSSLPPRPSAADGCIFVRCGSVNLPVLFSAFHRSCLHTGVSAPILPAAQYLLLLLSAASGSGLFFAAAFLPELPALLHPSILPCALVRAALLPATAAHALDALLMRLTAHSRYLRFRVPPLFLSAPGGLLSGALLLAAALAGTHTLPAALPLSLFWLSSPLLYAALDQPTIARIPLSPDQLSALRAGAESACLAVCSNPPCQAELPLRMLCEACGCMLRLFEPDEAARRTESLLRQYASSGHPSPCAADQAAMLVCAQFFREHMRDCDAALRTLPRDIEAVVLSSPLTQERSRLSAFLRAARTGDASAFSCLSDQDAAPLNALFLPLAPAKDMPPHPLTLPLTHPHTYLFRMEKDGQKQEEAAVSPGRFLAAAAAALSHPFYPLLMRSPVAAPYAALLMLA